MGKKIVSTNTRQEMKADDALYHKEKLGLGGHGAHEGWIESEESWAAKTDVCACEYTDHGQCGIVGEGLYGMDLQNDPSLELIARIAVSHARAGADFVAPSCMLDGMVSVIRQALDDEGFQETGIMSYSTKFASALYSPFREAADSGYRYGDRSTYQIHPGNSREAIRESEIDALEGADILMVKPGGFYLDLLLPRYMNLVSPLQYTR